MRKLLSTFVIVLAALTTQNSYAQLGWQWATKNSFSNISTLPMQDSWLAALGQSGFLYTVSTTGGSGGAVNVFTGLVTHYGSLSITDSGNGAQMIVAKLDSAGHYVWVKGTEHSDVVGTAVTTDAAGNLYVLGMYDSSHVTIGNGIALTNTYTLRKMYFIAKYDPSGTVLWAANVAPADGSGGVDVVYPSGTINVDGAGNVYVAGVFIDASLSIGPSTISNTTGDWELFVAKFDGTGHPLWAKGFGNVYNYISDLCSAMSPSGNLYLSGIFTTSSITFGSHTVTSATGAGIFITKFDSSGNAKWVREADGNTMDLTCSMTIDANQNIYMTGGFQNYRIIFGNDTLNNVDAGFLDMYLVRYDSSGNEKWAKSAGGIKSDQGLSVAMDQKGHLWTVGNMNGGFYSSGYTTNFGSTTLVEAPGGGMNDDPLYIAEYDTAGYFMTVSSITGGGDDQACILVDNKGSYYISGDWFVSNQVFGPDTLKPDSGYTELAFVAKYRYDTAFITLQAPPVTQAESGFVLYPNPADKKLVIEGANITAVTITNIAGQQLYSRTCNASKVEVDVAALPPGEYLLRVNDTEVRKFVKR